MLDLEAQTLSAGTAKEGGGMISPREKQIVVVVWALSYCRLNGLPTFSVEAGWAVQDRS